MRLISGWSSQLALLSQHPVEMTRHFKGGGGGGGVSCQILCPGSTYESRLPLVWPLDSSQYPGRKDAQLLNYLQPTFYFPRCSRYTLKLRFPPLHTGASGTVTVSTELPVVAVRRRCDCGLSTWLVAVFYC